MMGISVAAFAPCDVLEIFLRAEMKFVRLGKIRQRLGKTFRALFKIFLQLQPVLAQLLLEERMQHHRRRARVFHAFDVVNVLRQRRRRRHQRRTQFQTKIICGQVHDFSFPSFNQGCTFTVAGGLAAGIVISEFESRAARN